MRRWWRAFPLVAWSAAIWLVSAMPKPPEIPGQVSDKSAHAAAYAIHAATAWLAVPARGWNRVLVVLAVSSAWGALDEIHQSFVPNRDASALDWVADAAGVTVACLALWLVESVHRRRSA